MRSAIALSLSVFIAFLGLTVATPASAASEGSPDTTVASQSAPRYSGADRYDVAINVAAEYTAGVPVLYVAKGTDYPDALSAAPAAAAEGGPLLLTLPTSLLAKVRAEIVRLQPAKIVVVGGEASVSAAVYAELSTLTSNITRLGGADRYEASRNIVDYAFGRAGASRVYLATGRNFPDALAASAVAGGMGAAVILVDGKATSIDASTSALISELGPHDAAIAGGPASVSAGIEQSLVNMKLPGGSQRFTGADRYTAAASVNREAYDFADTVYMATGTNFPDALTGAVLAGSRQSPLFLVPGHCVTPSVATTIRSLSPQRIVVFGGPNSVSDAAQNLVECRPDVTPTATVTYSCSTGLNISVTNSNQNPAVVRMSYDNYADGWVDGDLTTATIAAESTYVNNNTWRLPEDQTTRILFQWNGGTFASQQFSVDCEAAPPVVVPPVTPPLTNPGDSKNCSDFSTWHEAQAWFLRYYPLYGDVAKLDSNNDLDACEGLPGHR
ncbi:excalibur calcium-binding domain-containing protein [Glaciihabitans tibetensis]|uniref:Excalibur calcium-binding domain-containing protein n=1 Tax=Glaciihabitans tibetensis TaxID=1266600 RepID=A0A2T0VJH4_9MICO|nr:cell wall-binding repeat-containing protein [Glaciihabitans tibetensis]PRY70343.1 excalibur calcium-binding domain-containing protein [Glaciihabitans tibetensis]